MATTVTQSVLVTLLTKVDPDINVRRSLCQVPYFRPIVAKLGFTCST
jgi:hypothetical protein